jgi:hypothetical protein
MSRWASQPPTVRPPITPSPAPSAAPGGPWPLRAAPGPGPQRLQLQRRQVLEVRQARQPLALPTLLLLRQAVAVRVTALPHPLLVQLPLVHRPGHPPPRAAAVQSRLESISCLLGTSPATRVNHWP